MSDRGRGPRVPPSVEGAPSPRDEIVSVPPGSLPPDSIDRRSSERFQVTWSVDCETEETFLYASITNISEVGIFVRTEEPLREGTLLTLRFAPPHTPEPFVLQGVVQWVNLAGPLRDSPNPGMGIQFIGLCADDRERLVEAIHTIAYVRVDPNPTN